MKHILNINQPHDDFFRSMLSDMDFVRDLLQVYLPKDILARSDLSTLRNAKTDYASPERIKHETDTLFCVDHKTECFTFYFLLEHQSSYEEKIFLRIRNPEYDAVNDFCGTIPAYKVRCI